VVKDGTAGSNLTFTISNVQRNNHNNGLTCQLLWVPNDVMVGQASYTILVACK
jgi:hypothetical protein